MPKAKILAIFSAAIIIAGLLSGCGSDTPLEPYESPLTGTWSESYSLLSPIDIIIEDAIWLSEMPSGLDEGMADNGITPELMRYTSVISFDNFNFELAIYDSLGTLHKEVKGDVDYRGDEVILTAQYSWFRYHEVWNIDYDPYAEYLDTLRIHRLDSDTLNLSTLSYAEEENGIFYILRNSFIWSVPGSLYMKTSATFSRDE